MAVQEIRWCAFKACCMIGQKSGDALSMHAAWLGMLSAQVKKNEKTENPENPEKPKKKTEKK